MVKHLKCSWILQSEIQTGKLGTACLPLHSVWGVHWEDLSGVGDSMARGGNHLEASLLACLVGWDLSCVVTWNTHVWLLHMASLGLPQRGCWKLQGCVPGEHGRDEWRSRRSRRRRVTSINFTDRGRVAEQNVKVVVILH